MPNEFVSSAPWLTRLLMKGALGELKICANYLFSSKTMTTLSGVGTDCAPTGAAVQVSAAAASQEHEGCSFIGFPGRPIRLDTERRQIPGRRLRHP